ncbi:exodeoxyribonuclease VII small subunit [Tautonia plasticadhaerens]|uniref:Exodeoxyribonuclease 7 small subunit n=1 Tax=Tautonia plasticadhaerens TaxID=2527974 RepID=A0A518HCW8_9BACT|nr:exodeoxyribonuclease VII small subunit [Tautonia plasticadhaerens]QDV38701.1 Exodeoxyribonuclease 7 small subunit [Tautonia plasticadhaerens]
MPPTEPPSTPDDPRTFEAALGQLETIVAELERGSLDLDASLSRYERGVRLLSRCRSTLRDAERRVALLTGSSPDGSPITTPFDAPTAASPDEPDDD